MPEQRTHEEMHADAERLAEILTSLQRRFFSKLSRDLSRGNISFAQYFLLSYLAQHAPLTMSEIAAAMGHTTAAATGLIDRLENLGYVKRAHAKVDRRKIMVESTESGLALVGCVRADMVENLIQLMGELTPDEQRAWLQIYEKIFIHYQQP